MEETRVDEAVLLFFLTLNVFEGTPTLLRSGRVWFMFMGFVFVSLRYWEQNINNRLEAFTLTALDAVQV